MITLMLARASCAPRPRPSLARQARLRSGSDRSGPRRQPRVREIRAKRGAARAARNARHRKRGSRCVAGSGGMQQPDRPSAGGVRLLRLRETRSELPGRPTLFFAQDKQDRPSGGANSRVRLPMQLCDEQPCGAPCVLPRSWRIARRETCHFALAEVLVRAWPLLSRDGSSSDGLARRYGLLLGWHCRHAPRAS